MISVDNNFGAASAVFEDFRLTGAESFAPHVVREFHTSCDYRIIVGRGSHVTVGGEFFALEENQAVLIAPNNFIRFESGEEGAHTADLYSESKLLEGNVALIESDECAHVSYVLSVASGANGVLRLTAAVCSLLASCLDFRGGDDAIANARRYFDKYFYLPLDISGVSSSAGYSRGYFTAKFTREVGCSPYKYITDARIRAAAKLLKDTDASVSVIASVCGYSGIERFSEMFSKYMSVSPAKYRATQTAK